jgi:anti-sigma factor RsiW
MNAKLTLQLQSYLDGELPDRQRHAVEAALSRDLQARGLLAELQLVRQTLTANEPARTVPASREFYWSGIAQAIDRLEAGPARPSRSPVLAWWRRLLLPAAGLAVLALTLSVTVLPPGGLSDADVDVSFPDSGAMTYRDNAQGVTLVWLGYPAEEPTTDYEAPPQAQEL